MLTLSREPAGSQNPAQRGLSPHTVVATPSFGRRIQWQAATLCGVALRLEGEAHEDGLGIRLMLAQTEASGVGRRHQAQLHLRSLADRQRSWPLGSAAVSTQPAMTLTLTLSEVPNSQRVNLWATCMLSADEAVHQVIGQWQRGGATA
jgi:hypothetical protein